MAEEIKEVVKEKEEKVYPVYPEVPTQTQDIVSQYVIDYCVANKQVKWLQETAQKKYVDKNGKEQNYNFFQIRKEFVLKFMPELDGKKNEVKKETLLDKIMALKVEE